MMKLNVKCGLHIINELYDEADIIQTHTHTCSSKKHRTALQTELQILYVFLNRKLSSQYSEKNIKCSSAFKLVQFSLTMASKASIHTHQLTSITKQDK